MKFLFPITTVAALLFPIVAHAGPTKLALYKGKYSVAIRMVVNGVTYNGTGAATLASPASGRTGKLKLNGNMIGGQGSAFPFQSLLSLKAPKTAKFDDISLGFTEGPAWPGKGKYSIAATRLKFRVSNPGGPVLNGIVKKSAKARKGKITLTIQANNPALLAPVAYTAQNTFAIVGAANHSYVLARPPGAAGPLPLVIAYHGDGGNGPSFRAQLKLEDQLRGRAVVAYRNVGDDPFDPYTLPGRNSEIAVTQEIIASLGVAGIVRTDRVFLSGISGGSVMANDIGFRLGKNTIRGVGAMSGSLYSNTGAGEPPINFATLPPALIVWGEADNEGGTQYGTDGLNTRDTYLNAYGAAAASPQPVAPSPMVIYHGATGDIWWASIPGMGHALWDKAPQALWAFFASRL